MNALFTKRQNDNVSFGVYTQFNSYPLQTSEHVSHILDENYEFRNKAKILNCQYYAFHDNNLKAGVRMTRRVLFEVILGRPAYK